MSRWRDSARPITSKPGPMLAEEQGVLIKKEVAMVGRENKCESKAQMIQQPVPSWKIGAIEQEGVVIVLPAPELYDSMRVLAREQKKSVSDVGDEEWSWSTADLWLGQLARSVRLG